MKEILVRRNVPFKVFGITVLKSADIHYAIFSEKFPMGIGWATRHKEGTPSGPEYDENYEDVVRMINRKLKDEELDYQLNEYLYDDDLYFGEEEDALSDLVEGSEEA